MFDFLSVVAILLVVGASGYWFTSQITGMFESLDRKYTSLEAAITECSAKQASSQLILENKLNGIEAQVASVAKDVNQLLVEVDNGKTAK